MIQKRVYFWGSLMNDTLKPQVGLEENIWRNINIEEGDGIIFIGRRYQ